MEEFTSNLKISRPILLELTAFWLEQPVFAGYSGIYRRGTAFVMIIAEAKPRAWFAGAATPTSQQYRESPSRQPNAFIDLSNLGL